MTSQADSATATAAGQFSTTSGFTVNRMGFGAMRVTGPGIWGMPEDLDESKRVLRRVVELDINFIDTADAYGPDVSENLIAELLYPYPRDLIIATKGGQTRPGLGQWKPNCRPEYLKVALEQSLRRLRVDEIPLYQLHRVDPNVPIEESVGALADLQREGKIQFIGLSNVNVEQLQQAQSEADIVSIQNRYNAGDRDSDPVLEECERQGIMFLPWGPLGQGNLAANVDVIDEIAAAHSSSVSQIALAWLLAKSPNIVVIPGTSRVSHLDENVAAAGIHLSADEISAMSGGAG